MSGIVDISVQLDLEALKATIKEAESLNDNAALFAKLSEVAKARALVGEAMDKVEAVESEAKLAINARAKALYGTDWKVIVGDGYKINRKSTGSLYEVTDPVAAKDYLEVTTKPDADKLKQYIRTHSALPEGISYSPDRGESISIKVQPGA